MNILNKVKQGMIDSTKAIKEKSCDVTELTKLRISLSKNTAKVEELYYDLGKKTANCYIKGDAMELPDEITILLVEIKLLLEEIKESNTRIESLKGILKCSVCGLEVEENDHYCSNCGHLLKLKPDLEDTKKPSVDHIESEENATPKEDSLKETEVRDEPKEEKEENPE